MRQARWISGLVANAIEGVRYGLFLATCFAGFVLLRVLFSGGEYGHRLPFTLWALLAVYYVGGIVGGGLAGVLSPLGRRLVGRIAVGLVVGPVVASFFFLLVIPKAEWAEELLPLSIVVGGLVGGIAAGASWGAEQRRAVGKQ